MNPVALSSSWIENSPYLGRGLKILYTELWKMLRILEQKMQRKCKTISPGYVCCSHSFLILFSTFFLKSGKSEEPVEWPWIFWLSYLQRSAGGMTSLLLWPMFTLRLDVCPSLNEEHPLCYLTPLLCYLHINAITARNWSYQQERSVMRNSL